MLSGMLGMCEGGRLTGTKGLTYSLLNTSDLQVSGIEDFRHFISDPVTVYT